MGGGLCVGPCMYPPTGKSRDLVLPALSYAEVGSCRCSAAEGAQHAAPHLSRVGALCRRDCGPPSQHSTEDRERRRGGRVPPPQAQLPIPKSSSLCSQGRALVLPLPSPCVPRQGECGWGGWGWQWPSAQRWSWGGLSGCMHVAVAFVRGLSVRRGVLISVCVSQELKLCTPTMAAGGHRARGPPGWVINFISLFLAQTELAEGHSRRGCGCAR